MKSHEEYLKAANGDAGKAMAAFAADLRAETVANATKSLKVAVSKAKGGVMVLGLNSFPLTLYADQWVRLSEFLPTVLAYIDKNKAEITKIEAAGKAAKSAESAAS
jgi:hypothetical protein